MPSRKTLHFNPALDALRIPLDVLAELPERLLEAQAAFHKTGGVHAAGLFTVGPISVDRATAAVHGDEAGAVVSFSGVVRNHDGGMAVSKLSYSAHPTAHHVLADVVDEMVAEHSAEVGRPVRVWVAHRVGVLQVGDPALVCAVSAAHRGQAFDVCSQLVDRIKPRVPIWKEQFFVNGTVEWVGADEQRLFLHTPSQLSTNLGAAPAAGSEAEAANKIG
jgi:molybdopterin synthase catalytic subunit